jgi:hypothetical protein
MTIVSWTLIVLLLLALLFTVGSAAGKLPLWPAVLLLIVVELLAGRVALP